MIYRIAKSFALTAVALAIAPALCLAQTATPGADATPPSAPARSINAPATAAVNVSSRYVLGVGDEIVIHAIDAPEISEKTQRIDPDGDLRLAIVGRIHAAGMMLSALEQELTKRLSVFLQQPDVTVTVTSSKSQSVSILGAVSSPGPQPIGSTSTLLDILSAAGGLTADAGPIVRVVRKAEQGAIRLPEAQTDAQSGFSVMELDVRALLDGLTPEKNIAIVTNDVITVPRAAVVYVIGEVGKPGPLQLSASRSMTVMEAVSTSGGVLKTAAPSKVRILRRVAGQEERAEINVDLQLMMQGKAKDMPLLVGDILVVPDSTGKRIAARAIEAAIQTGLLIGTYSVVN